MNQDLERDIRAIIVQELFLAVKALGSENAANRYSLESFRADQRREAEQQMSRGSAK